MRRVSRIVRFCLLSNKEKYQDQYTDAEKEHIGKLKGTCLWYETQHSVKNLKQGMKDAVKEAKGMIEGFTDAASDK